MIFKRGCNFSSPNSHTSKVSAYNTNVHVSRILRLNNIYLISWISQPCPRTNSSYPQLHGGCYDRYTRNIRAPSTCTIVRQTAKRVLNKTIEVTPFYIQLLSDEPGPILGKRLTCTVRIPKIYNEHTIGGLPNLDLHFLNYAHYMNFHWNFQV
jgi:hypothetical protein